MQATVKTTENRFSQKSIGCFIATEPSVLSGLLNLFLKCSKVHKSEKKVSFTAFSWRKIFYYTSSFLTNCKYYCPVDSTIAYYFLQIKLLLLLRRLDATSGEKTNQNQPSTTHKKQEQKKTLWKFDYLEMRAFILRIKYFFLITKFHKTLAMQEFVDIFKRVSTTFKNPCLDTTALIKRWKDWKTF